MAHGIHEGPLPLPGHRQAIEQIVEGAGDSLQFAGLGSQRQALAPKGFGFDLLNPVAELLQGPESGVQHRPQQGGAHQGGYPREHQHQQGVALLPADVEGHLLQDIEHPSCRLGAQGRGAREIALPAVVPGASHRDAPLPALHQGLERQQDRAAIQGAEQGPVTTAALDDPGVHPDEGELGGQGSLLVHQGQQLAGHLPVGLPAVEVREPSVGHHQHPITRQHRDHTGSQQPLPQGATGAGQQGNEQAQQCLPAG